MQRFARHGAWLLGAMACCGPSVAMTQGHQQAAQLGATATPLGWTVVAVFTVAYLLVALEERTGLRKSKPVMLAAALTWGLIAWSVRNDPMQSAHVADAFERMFLEFAELFFFLIVAMTFVGAMTERGVFDVLRAALVRRGLGYRALFWIAGTLAFFLSAVLDNLTAALVVSAIVLAVGAGNARFIAICLVSVVVAANAGGAWCAFGDITTLMVWQAQRVEFFDFFRLFLPALTNWLVPAALMTFALPSGRPAPNANAATMKFGGWAICALFALTIAITVLGRQALHMPPVCSCWPT